MKTGLDLGLDQRVSILTWFLTEEVEFHVFCVVFQLVVSDCFDSSGWGLLKSDNHQVVQLQRILFEIIVNNR